MAARQLRFLFLSPVSTPVGGFPFSNQVPPQSAADLAWHGRCGVDVVADSKRFVYILRSRRDPDRYYTGVSSNLRERLAAHNSGACVHTAAGRPWDIDVVIAFRDQPRALALERYLKSGSGMAFSKKRLR